MTYPKITSDDDRAEPGADHPSEPPVLPKLAPGGVLPPLAEAAARYIEVHTGIEAEADREAPTYGLTAMPYVHGLDGSSIQVSDAAEPDGMWFRLIGGRDYATPAGDEEHTTAKFDIREAVVLAHCIIVLARRRGYNIPDTLSEASALAHEERKRWAEPDPGPEPGPVDVEPEADPGEPYDIDTVGALGEAATWARRWSTERQRADGLAAELERIDALHAPYIDEHGNKRCRGCIAGYDPRTRELTHCAYPCPTAMARAGQLPLL
jgi:hypothetical protein